MLRFWAILLAPVIANAVLIEAIISQPVKLGYATYQGTFNSNTDITSFFGLRYATPPVGAVHNPFQQSALNIALHCRAPPFPGSEASC
jgi:hypothetical protein